MLTLIMKMRSRSGFTLIEIVVVITALGIIASVLTVNYLNIQKHSRDSKRIASAIIVSESLEKYYSQNGEYPSVATVTNPDAALVKQALSIPTINSLLGPSAQAGSNLNAWKSGTASASNHLTYAPNTDNSASCLTGSTAADSCIDYKLQYYKEETETIETIISRDKAAAAPAAPTAPTITAPTAPTITAALSGSNAVGTRSDTSCRVGAQLLYAFHWRMNDGAWSNYTTWDSTTTSISTPVAQGVKYGFQVKAKCVEGDYSSAEAISGEATYTHPITTPAAPIVNQSTAGTTTTFSVNTITCPAGTTAQVQYHLTTDWGYNGAWTAPLTNSGTHIINTANQGYEYIDEAQARCTNSFDTSSWSASGTSSYISPVTPPGGASNYVATMNAGATQLTWSFTRPTCHASVTPAINWNIYVDNGWTINGLSGWTGWRNAIVTNTNMTQTVTLTPTSSPTFSSGGRSALTTEWYCINQTTSRQSTIGPRVQSATYTYTP
jgi:prepilin-type N-terminal cleavage/methylation domain-containing protein